MWREEEAGSGTVPQRVGGRCGIRSLEGSYWATLLPPLEGSTRQIQLKGVGWLGLVEMGLEFSTWAPLKPSQQPLSDTV